MTVFEHYSESGTKKAFVDRRQKDQGRKVRSLVANWQCLVAIEMLNFPTS